MHVLRQLLVDVDDRRVLLARFVVGRQVQRALQLFAAEPLVLDQLRITDRRIVQPLDVPLPLLRVRAQDAAVVRDEAVDLALDVGRLRPNTTRASEALDLVFELREEKVGSVIVGFVRLVNFVGLIDGVDGLLDIPEAVWCWLVWPY